MTEARHRAGKIPKFYTIRSVADALEVHERTVRRWIKKGDLKAHYMGAAVRISDTDLSDFIQSSRPS